MLNEISEGINGGWGKDARTDVLAKLVEYTLVHFATEEDLMQLVHYPDEGAHKAYHQNLIETVQNYIKKYDEDPNASNYDLLFFLKKWLIEHILKNDKRLGRVHKIASGA